MTFLRVSFLLASFFAAACDTPCGAPLLPGGPVRRCDGVVPDGGMFAVDWVPPLVPIGQPAIEIRGSAFQTENPAMSENALSVTMQSGSISIPTTVVNRTASVLTVQPSWPAQLMSGDATITVKQNGMTAPTKATKLITIALGAPAKSAMFSPVLSNPQFHRIYQGSYLMNTLLFVVAHNADNAADTLFTVGYASGTFSGNPTSQPVATTQLIPATIDNSKTTGFFSFDQATPNSLTACHMNTATSVYNCGILNGSGFGTMTGMLYSPSLVPTVLAAGATDNNNALFVFSHPGPQNKLMSCPYGPTNMPWISGTSKAQLCTEVGSEVNAEGGVLTVERLVSGSNRASIIFRDAQSNLSIYSADGSGKYSRCGDCLDANASAPSITSMSVADIDNDGDLDIVAANTGGLKTFINGQGKFTSITVPVDRMDALAMAVADVSGDSLPDVVIRNTAGQLSVWINLSDGQSSGLGNGRFIGPVALKDTQGQITLGPKDQFIFDGTPGTPKRRLLATSVSDNLVKAWPNLSQ